MLVCGVCEDMCVFVGGWVCVCARQGGYVYVWEEGVGEWVCMYVCEGRVGRVGMCACVREGCFHSNNSCECDSCFYGM